MDARGRDESEEEEEEEEDEEGVEEDMALRKRRRLVSMQTIRQYSQTCRNCHPVKKFK